MDDPSLPHTEAEESHGADPSNIHFSNNAQPSSFSHRWLLRLSSQGDAGIGCFGIHTKGIAFPNSDLALAQATPIAKPA